MKQIAPNIYVQDGYHGVTVGCIVTDAGAICIDSPMLPADARDWRAQIAKRTGKPVRFVVLTDAHRDRILGVQYLGDPVVVAHEAAWDKMKSLGDAFRQQAADSVAPCGADAAAEVSADLRLVLPQITFVDTLALYLGDLPVIIRHVGGATPGSSWVHLPQSNVLFMGDLLTVNYHPSAAEGDLAAWLELLGRVQQKDFAAKVIVPGRGAPARKAALASMAGYLDTMRERVQALVRARKPRADTAQLVPEFLARYPVAADDRECVQRRIKAGLDHIYDTLKIKK
jgi:glyoxylase-like metal-dependent hydrolase (beta-lactamase superfamily II)